MTIYWQANPSRRLNPKAGKWEGTGKVFDEYLLAYYQGSVEGYGFKPEEVSALAPLQFIARDLDSGGERRAKIEV